MSTETMTANHDDAQRQAEARFHAYNDFLKQSHVDPMGEAFVAGWKAGVEYREKGLNDGSRATDRDSSKEP